MIINMYLQRFGRQLYKRPFICVLAFITGCVAITILDSINPRSRVHWQDPSGQRLQLYRATQSGQLTTTQGGPINEELSEDAWYFVTTAPDRTRPYNDPSDERLERNNTGMRTAHGIGRICSQQERIAHVQTVCRKLNRTITSPSSHSIVDHRHRLLVCWMSKIGCTAMKSALLEANGFIIEDAIAINHNMMYVHMRSFLGTYGLRMVQDMNASALYSVMNEYFKMVTVRHPFERLLSTYRGKIVDKESDLIHLVREILQETRPEEFEQTDLAEMDDFTVRDLLGSPTFVEFLTWVKSSKNANEHWSVMTDDCHICSHDWNAILRIETMEYDEKVLLEKLAPDLSSFPIRHSHQEHASPVHAWIRVPEYENVDKSIIDYFMDLYKDDMEIFGYKWDGSKHIASCEIQTESGTCC